MLLEKGADPNVVDSVSISNFRGDMSDDQTHPPSQANPRGAYGMYFHFYTTSYGIPVYTVPKLVFSKLQAPACGVYGFGYGTQLMSTTFFFFGADI